MRLTWQKWRSQLSCEWWSSSHTVHHHHPLALKPDRQSFHLLAVYHNVIPDVRYLRDWQVVGGMVSGLHSSLFATLLPTVTGTSLPEGGRGGRQGGRG